MNFREKYTREIDSLQFSSNLEAFLVCELKETTKRKDFSIMIKRRKTFKVFIAVISAVLLLSVSAFAISSLLSAQQVADAVGKSELSDKWQKSENYPATYSDENYTVSLLGIASDTQLVAYDGLEIEEDHNYFVISIARTDGQPLNIADGSPLQVSPFIQGCPPWRVNLWSFGASANGTSKDGVLYYLFDVETFEIFADKTVYIGVYEGFVPHPDLMIINEDGTIDFHKNYSGFKALFELPLDKSKADKEKANDFLKEHGITE